MSRDMTTTFLCLIWFLSLSKLYASVECQLPQKPHIIFIISDDLGWNDVSFHGSQQFPTPNIDALAHDGIILNNYYVLPICTPSRAALLTGKHPIKLGLQHFVIKSQNPYGLPLNETILSQHLKQLGYATHGIGKWHLGFFKNEYLPVNRGFDSFFGFWTGFEDYFTHFAKRQGYSGLDFHDNNNNEWNYDGIYGTEVFTKKAVDLIESHNSSQPLFLYFAHQAVHVGNAEEPFQAPLRYIEKFRHIKDPDRKVFAGMVSAMDDSIGELFSALNKSKMLENSIIIFFSDNGGEIEGYFSATGSNYPLKGGKFTLWEGGVRSVGFVWSHFLRNVRKVSNELMHITDWLPTLYTLAGGDPETLRDIDGIDQWPSICCGESSKRKEVLLNIDPEWKLEGIRRGKYKLVKGSAFNGSFDDWFDKQGKRRCSTDFTEDELNIYRDVYKETAKQSLVQSVLLENYGKKYFIDFCCPSTFDRGRYQQKNESDSWTCSNYISSDANSINCLDPVTINCGLKSQIVSTECDLIGESCLFNVEDDPCEFDNILASKPEVVAELEEALNNYRAKAVQILNQPEDPSSNPKYHGNAWIPWK